MKSVVISSVIIIFAIVIFYSCQSSAKEAKPEPAMLSQEEQFIAIDTSKIPHDKFGEAVRYGKDLILNTAYYIGPNGINGNYLGNKMNCTNCHQDGGTKPFSFNLMSSHDNYPQYRSREGKILTLAERVNNCVMRPHNGKPLPLDSKEMVAILSYFKWINGFVPKNKTFKGAKNMEISFPATAASSERGKILLIRTVQDVMAMMEKDNGMLIKQRMSIHRCGERMHTNPVRVCIASSNRRNG